MAHDPRRLPGGEIIAECVVLGAGLGGLPAAFELKRSLRRTDHVTVIKEADRFCFVPSNPWVAVGWRSPRKVSLPLLPSLRRKGIDLIVGQAAEVRPAQGSIVMTDLRRRRLRSKVPMTFVTSEPYVGHLGLGGVGDSKGMLEPELRSGKSSGSRTPESAKCGLAKSP